MFLIRSAYASMPVLHVLQSKTGLCYMNGSVCFPRAFGLQPAWRQTRLRQENCHVTWSLLSGILTLLFDTHKMLLRLFFHMTFERMSWKSDSRRVKKMLNSMFDSTERETFHQASSPDFHETLFIPSFGFQCIQYPAKVLHTSSHCNHKLHCFSSKLPQRKCFPNFPFFSENPNHCCV